MRKRRFTKQVGVVFTEELYKTLIEVTDELEVSVSEFVRSIVEKELRKGKFTNDGRSNFNK